MIAGMIWLGDRLGPAVTMATTEHFNLQTARAATISEANGRARIYLATLSTNLIALAFIAPLIALYLAAAVLKESVSPRLVGASLELGGKNPNLVFADADLEKVVEMSVRAAFTNQGQICLSGSRIFVEKSAYGDFVQAFCERVKKLKVGDPLEDGVDQGALVSRAHMDKVLGYMDVAKREGGKIECGGAVVEKSKLPERCRDGYFLQPTVITGLPATSRTCQEEIFGPVLALIAVDGYDEAIACANDTEYGLSAAIATSDARYAHRFARDIQAGTVNTGANEVLPDGGQIDLTRTLQFQMADESVARIGGEEFAVWLPHAQLGAALEVAERIRDLIANTTWHWSATAYPLTASCGVASYPDPIADLLGLPSAADAALFRAKELGRNRVEKAHRPH